MTTIEDIKKQLGEIIELSDKATPGEWTTKKRFQNSFEISKPHIWLGESSSLPTGQQKHNASFVATSRNLTPKMAKALLTAIEALEWMNNDEHGGEVCDNDGRGCRACGYAQNQLETIRREWEVKA